jgi:hypothetical protein
MTLKSLEEMQAEVWAVNESNGWYDSERTVGDDIALLHSEVSEMFEAYRDHGFDDVTAPPLISNGENPKPEGFGSVCADVLIRLLDTCDRRGVNLRAEYERKIAYNKTRGYKHGGKRL